MLRGERIHIISARLAEPQEKRRCHEENRRGGARLSARDCPRAGGGAQGSQSLAAVLIDRLRRLKTVLKKRTALASERGTV